MFFECPNCRNIIDAEKRWAGKLGECPHCRKKVPIPEITGASANADPGDLSAFTKLILWIVVLGIAGGCGVGLSKVSLYYRGPEYRAGYSAGSLEGTKATVLALSGHSYPTEGMIDYLAEESGRRSGKPSESYRTGFRKGFNDKYKP